MAITLDTMTDENVDDFPPCFLAYGPEGIGKSSFFASFPSTAFIRIAERVPQGFRPKGWTITSYAQLQEALAVLETDEHAFKFIVIDSVTSLEQKIIWPEICLREGVKNIEDCGFGKGYKNAMTIWEEVFNALDALRENCGIGVGLIGHSVIKEFKDPENVAYSVYDVALQDGANVSAARFVKQRADTILFLKKEISAVKQDPNNKFDKRVIAKGGDTRWIFTEGRPAFAAKNRYNMPEKIQFQKGGGFEAIAPYIPFLAEHVAAETEQAA